jgi:hypothetical protein
MQAAQAALAVAVAVAALSAGEGPEAQAELPALTAEQAVRLFSLIQAAVAAARVWVARCLSARVW